MCKKMYEESLYSSIMKVSNSDKILNFIQSKLNSFLQKGEVTFNWKMGTMDGTMNNNRNHIRIYVTNNSVNMFYGEEEKLLTAFTYNISEDYKIKIRYEKVINRNNEDKTLPSTLFSSVEYNYDNNRKFVSKETIEKDISYMVKDDQKQLINGWYCNYKTREFIKRISEDKAVKHYSKKYVCYKNHDIEEYGLSNNFCEDAYSLDGFSCLGIVLFDEITKNEYKKINEELNKQKVFRKINK